MNKLSFTDNNGATWVRINKTTANKMWDAGVSVCFVPCNIRPFGAWNLGWVANKKDHEKVGSETDFLKIVNSFIYYNCINTETGKVPAYYIKQEVRV